MELFGFQKCGYDFWKLSVCTHGKSAYKFSVVWLVCKYVLENYVRCLISFCMVGGGIIIFLKNDVKLLSYYIKMIESFLKVVLLVN